MVLPGSGGRDSVAGAPGKAEKVPVLDSPCSVASDGSSTNWNGIPRVRRKWIDVVEGKNTVKLRSIRITIPRWKC